MKLLDFAFIPSYTNGKCYCLERIAGVAFREDWGENYSHLRTYCDFNFEIAESQGRIYCDEDSRFALWRIGHLTTNDGIPIYAYFVKNNAQNRQAYKFKTIICNRNNVVIYYKENGNELTIRVPCPPKEPEYAIPLYQPSYELEYNWNHFLKDHESRMKTFLPNIQDRLLYLAIFGSVELAHKRYKAEAVPQYYKGRYEHLLPLYITHDLHSDQRPDFVAALEEDRDRGIYTIKTLLSPDWAYRYARAIAIDIARIRPWIKESSFHS